MKAFVTEALFREHRLEVLAEKDFEFTIQVESEYSLKVQRLGDLLEVSSLSAEGSCLQPAITFEIGEDLKWRPVALMGALMGKREAIIYCEGKRWVDTAEMDYLIEFSQDWARDLKSRCTQ